MRQDYEPITFTFPSSTADLEGINLFHRHFRVAQLSFNSKNNKAIFIIIYWTHHHELDTKINSYNHGNMMPSTHV